MALEDRTGLTGIVVAELFDGATGELKARHRGKNLVTAVGDQSAGQGFTSQLTLTAYPVGMKLGTGSTAPAKTGAGAALVTYLTGSTINTFNPAITSGSVVGGVVTYKCTWTTGVATTASPITEVVLYGPANTGDVTTPASNTVARALITGISQKLSTDVLVVTWTITFLGA